MSRDIANMAATITSTRVILPLCQNGHNNLFKGVSSQMRNVERFKSTKPSAKVAKTTNEGGQYLAQDRRMEFDMESLAARGYLRNQKPYTPPRDVESTVLGVCKKHMGNQATFPDAKTKFNVLVHCSQNFNHSLPNSLIHKINNIDELMMFYKTPVNTTVPLDMMKDMNLPKNLHVIYKYHRFHPETDTKFGGISAYTGESTIVTGLKYKKKYPGYTAEKPWPFKSENI